MGKSGNDGDSVPRRLADVAPGQALQTDREIASLYAERASGARKAYRVSGARGFRVELRPGGSLAWSIVYRPKNGGRPRKYTIGRYPETSLKAARDRAREVRALVDLGRDPQVDKLLERRSEKERLRRESGAATVQAFALRLLGDAEEPAEARPLKLSEASLDNWRYLLGAEVGPAFGDRLPATITRAEIRAWGARIARRAPYVANRSFQFLRRIFSWAIENDLIEATPFVRLQVPFGDEKESDRVLSTDELRCVWGALRKLRGPYPDAFRLLALTGVRLGMVLAMRVDEIDGLEGQAPRWTIPGAKTKGKRAHVVPLSPPAVAILRGRLELLDGPYVFPSHHEDAETPHMTWSSKWVISFRVRVERVRSWLAHDPKLRPMPRWTVHGLRHTVATHLREDLKVPSDVVSLILIHAVGGPAVSRIYNRSELLPERRAALEAWARWLDALVTHSGLESSADRG